MNPYPQQGGYPPAPGQPYPAYPPAGAGQQYPPPGQQAYGQQPPVGAGGYPPGAAPGGYQQPAAPMGGYSAPAPQGYGASGEVKQFIPGGLTPGRMITASLVPGPTKFAINLRHSDNGDIAFHFNPRLPDNVVVRNTCISGGWQNEERQQPHFPFRAGQPCTVLILCEPTQFKVAVNGQHYMEYRLRTQNLQMIQLVEISGDFSNGTIQLQ